ncbi:MAG: hypothetical protein K8R18_06125 [Parvibaculum sp.]|uniref:hypothetical protein n=1 Tax=Parvibaculum sp. TaxID=2024848 RepID=UPI0025D1AD7D|nr:hypothetical protein [Parvibaculum sp.]MCE9649188.1 hypothetical protein [Parvibaculum sp.]
MVYRRRLLALPLLLAVVFAGGRAHAADAPAPNAPDRTLIDITGEISTGSLSGGVADPVPLFVGASGPVVFVMTLPPAEDALARAHRTHIRANPELNRPR